MTCYRGDNDEDYSRRRRLSFPATVVRGEAVTCYVNASMLWDRHLQLVITDCRFTSAFAPNRSSLTYHFIHNKYVAYE